MLASQTTGNLPDIATADAATRAAYDRAVRRLNASAGFTPADTAWKLANLGTLTSAEQTAYTSYSRRF